jgi:hypothetical protein
LCQTSNVTNVKNAFRIFCLNHQCETMLSSNSSVLLCLTLLSFY